MQPEEVTQTGGSTSAGDPSAERRSTQASQIVLGPLQCGDPWLHLEVPVVGVRTRFDEAVVRDDLRTGLFVAELVQYGTGPTLGDQFAEDRNGLGLVLGEHVGIRIAGLCQVPEIGRGRGGG